VGEDTILYFEIGSLNLFVEFSLKKKKPKQRAKKKKGKGELLGTLSKTSSRRVEKGSPVVKGSNNKRSVELG
jgi:hypothetical protein